MTFDLPDEGQKPWGEQLNDILTALDRRTDRIFTPWQYGAVGNPEAEADDTDAINECVEAAQDNDGLVFINGRFGFASEVFFKGGVPILGSAIQRLTSPATAEPGLVGIDGAGTVRWGKFSDGSGSANDNPGPIMHLAIDGQGIAGDGGELFRAECAQGSLIDLIVRNSAGDGIDWASSQNVNVWNLQNQGHAGYAHDFIGRIAGAQPPGHITFFGGHHGDSYGTIRLRSHDATFFVGPHDIVFYGPILEGGRTTGQAFDCHVLLEDGKLTLVNPTVTIGASVPAIDQDAVIVLKNEIRPAASTILVLNDPELGGGAGSVKATDLIRMENSGGALNEVRINGTPQLANADYGVNFDGGAGLLSIDNRPRYVTAFTALLRATNGGDLTGFYQRTNTPRRIEVPADSSVSALQIREEGKAANAFQVAKNGEIRILDPDTGATLGVISPVSGGGLLINGPSGGQGNLLHVAHYTTATRPAASGLPYRTIFDTDLGIPLWSDGTEWLTPDRFSQINANRVTGAQETYPREFGITTGAQTSQLLRLTYFTAYKSMTVNSLRSATGAVAAGATPTTCKMGLYSVAANGDLTRIGITANDTALWSTINSLVTKALTASVGVTAGNRYAFATLCDTGATAPNLVGRTISQVIANANNRLGGTLTAQTDIPASITAASVAVNGIAIYGELV